MSAEAMAWAKRQRVGDAVAKSVLMELANWTDGVGVACYRKVKQLADLIEVSERTIQRRLRDLEDNGWIRRLPRMRDDGKGQLANQFELLRYIATLEGGFDVSDCHPGGDTADTPKNRDMNISIPQAREEGRQECHPELPEGVSQSDWDAYVAMRSRIDNPIDDGAEETVIRRTLIKFANAGQDPAQILREATRRRRAWLEPVKAEKTSQRRRLPEKPKGLAGGERPLRLRAPDEPVDCARAREAIASAIGPSRYRHYMDPASARLSLAGEQLRIVTSGIASDALGEQATLSNICRAVHHVLPQVAAVRIEGSMRLPRMYRHG